jgi:prepilin-type N-terminal cleavage/methylation domain-containing protein
MKKQIFQLRSRQAFQLRSRQAGFTLIELLVVIAIIGLLSTIAVVALNSARLKSRDAKRVSDIKQIQTALELYYNDASNYPATVDVASGGSIASNGVTYMAIIPTNPSPRDCADNEYTYAAVGDPVTSYTLAYCLGGVTGGLSSGAHTASPSGISN